jgi:hypothetical protein
VTAYWQSNNNSHPGGHRVRRSDRSNATNKTNAAGHNTATIAVLPNDCMPTPTRRRDPVPREFKTIAVRGNVLPDPSPSMATLTLPPQNPAKPFYRASGDPLTLKIL